MAIFLAEREQMRELKAGKKVVKPFISHHIEKQCLKLTGPNCKSK